MIQIISATIFASLFLVSAATAEPTYQQTVGFIKTKTDGASNVDSVGTQRSQYVSFLNKCSIQISTVATFESGSIARSVVSARLNSIDPTRVEVSGAPGNIVLLATSNSRVIKIEMKINNDPDTVSYHYLGTIFVHEPHYLNAPKVQKAIVHLIKLCGGKGELF